MARKKRSKSGFLKMLEDSFRGKGPVSKRGRKTVKKAGITEIMGFKI